MLRRDALRGRRGGHPFGDWDGLPAGFLVEDRWKLRRRGVLAGG